MLNKKNLKNSYISSVIKVSFFLVLFLASFSFANAAASFNNAPGDFPVIEVSKTLNCDNCWGNSVSANANDIISFEYFYHNTSNETAKNVRIRSALPTGSVTNTSVPGTLSADNASSVSGSVNVTLSSSQTTTFIPGSTRWYPQKSATINNLQVLPNGQTGSEIFGSGINLGDIGANKWGIIIFRAQISNNTPPPTVIVPNAVTISASSITQTSASISGTVNPNGNNTTAWFEYGTAQSLGAKVGSNSIGNGNSSINQTYFLTNLQPNTTYFYRMVGQNSAGTTNGNILSFTTNANNPPPPPVSGSAPTINTGPAFSVTQTSASISGTVNPNGNNTTAWFEYGTAQSLGNIIGSQSVNTGSGSGSGNVSLNAFLSNLQVNTTYYYRVMAQNDYGTTNGNILSFTTNANNPPPVQQNGSAPSVSTGGTNSVGQTYASVSGTVYPNGDYTNAWFEYGSNLSLGYTSSHQSAGNGPSQFILNSSFGALQPNTTYYYRAVANNSYGTARGSIMSFTTQSSYDYYQQQSGSAPSAITGPATSVSQTSASISGTVNPNGNNATAWFEYGTTQILGTTQGQQSVGSSNSSINISTSLPALQQNTVYYYRVVVQNSFGTSQGSIYSFSTFGGTQSYLGFTPEAPFVSTQVGSGISPTSGVARGLFSPKNNPTNIWFEYGTTASLGLKTATQAMGASGDNLTYSVTIEGLKPNTIYYYKAVAQNNYGTRTGNIQSFTTDFAPIVSTERQVVSTPVIVPAVKISAPVETPIVILTSDVNIKQSVQYDELNYQFIFRNDSNTPIADISIKTDFPHGSVLFVRADANLVSTGSGQLLFKQNSLDSHTQGQVTAVFAVREGVSLGTAIPFVTTMIYRDTNGKIQTIKSDSSSVVTGTDNTLDNGNQSASIFSSGIFSGFSKTLLTILAVIAGSIFVILLILFLPALIKKAGR